MKLTESIHQLVPSLPDGSKKLTDVPLLNAHTHVSLVLVLPVVLLVTILPIDPEMFVTVKKVGIMLMNKSTVTNVQLLVNLVLKLVLLLLMEIVKYVLLEELLVLNQPVHVQMVKLTLTESVNHVPTNVPPVLVLKIIVLLVLMITETHLQLVTVMMVIGMMVKVVPVILVKLNVKLVLMVLVVILVLLIEKPVLKVFVLVMMTIMKSTHILLKNVNLVLLNVLLVTF